MEFKIRNGGLRRFQNPDGSLTPEGRIRYAKQNAKADLKIKRIEAKYNVKTAKVRAKQEAAENKIRAKLASKEKKTESKQASIETNKKRTDTSAKKTVKTMSDSELQSVINRMQNEENYNRLMANRQTFGKKVVNTVLKEVITPSLIKGGKNFLSTYIGNIGEKLGSNAAKSTLGQMNKDKKKK